MCSLKIETQCSKPFIARTTIFGVKAVRYVRGNIITDNISIKIVSKYHPIITSKRITKCRI